MSAGRIPLSRRAFCTDLSRASGEPLPGTGEHLARILLLRWPKGGWDRRIFAAPDMEAELVAAIDALRLPEDGTQRRVQLVDRKGEVPGRHRLFLYPEGLTREVVTADLARVLHALHAGDLTDWTAQDRPVLPVCTHGLKDRCCAKFGFAAYRALAEAAKTDHDPEVWESTHLGGCRLSGSALSLPAMRKYGRLARADVPALLADEAAGRAHLPAWRGPSHLESEAQAAAVAAEGEARRLGGRASGDPARDAECWAVPATLPGGEAVLRVVLTPVTMRRPGTCDDLDAGEITEAIGWRPATVSVVADASPGERGSRGRQRIAKAALSRIDPDPTRERANKISGVD